MNADERRFEVLRAIVADYVATQEPVGSKALVDRHNLGVSSATVRNDMAALEEEGFAVDYMEVMDYGVPNYYALMLVTGEDQLEANRDKYTRFLRACQKGFADMQADPEEALGLLLANQDEENFPLTESVERRSFDVLLPIMETADAPFLSQDVSVWQENIDWLQKVGMIDAAFDPAEVMVDLLAE